ncbi:MAG TPA: cytochrome c biogenesis protein CcsA, partial [Spirochaetota bacterium]|nr:cytochrome c biogenesis protein CcsA [Spirochaetota bacterium]
MFLYRLVYILMPIGIFLSLLWVPPANILGDASRILYFHVPVAWVSFLAFIIAGIHSIVLLIKKSDIPCREAMAYNSAAIGMVFTVLTVITGSIWAKVS